MPAVLAGELADGRPQRVLELRLPFVDLRSALAAG